VTAQETQLQVDLAKLPTPERAYYANTAICRREGRLASFAFGQFQVGRRDAVQSAMGIDIPERSIPAIASTFSEGFRRSLGLLMADYGRMSPFPIDSEQPKSVIYPAHMARIAISELECAIDFYTVDNLGPFAQEPPSVVAVMRIRCFAPVVNYFVRACDDVAKGEQ